MLNLPITQIIALYKAGQSARKIATKFDCSPSVILKRLRSEDITIQKQLNLPLTQIIALYKAGQSTREIAAKFDCSHWVILRRLRSEGITTQKQIIDPIKRFWSHVNKNGPVPTHCLELGPCWIWTASLDKKGYGQFTPKLHQSGSAHRYINEFKHGPIPKGIAVCHHCDNPACVRDSHLFRGTQQQNMADAAAKGRLKGKCNSRLTEHQVIQIRKRRAAGVPRRVLAAEYGVAASHISLIALGGTWKYVGGPIMPSKRGSKRLISNAVKSSVRKIA